MGFDLQPLDIVLQYQSAVLGQPIDLDGIAATNIDPLAQVNQGYDESLDDVRSKLAFDLAYSVALLHPWRWLVQDVHIIGKTIAIMVGKKGR